MRLARQRKLFVEAKKPSVRIDTDRVSSFQIRRYGFSANLPISVLTNFRHLAVYDCRTAPRETAAAHVCRRLLVSYEEFEARFDDLWPLLSRESVFSGQFDQLFEVDPASAGVEQFDNLFLDQVRDWRRRLAEDIHRNTPGLTSAELTYVVQLFLSRIIFLRICEDRAIERYETLRKLDRYAIFDALMQELRRADAFYDSGLFRLMDDQRLGIRIDDTTLGRLIEELYYPASPYTFAVVEPENPRGDLRTLPRRDYRDRRRRSYDDRRKAGSAGEWWRHSHASLHHGRDRGPDASPDAERKGPVRVERLHGGRHLLRFGYVPSCCF